jgi:flagellin
MDSVLTAATSSALTSIQRTQSAQDRFQSQLATGRSVNALADNAKAFVLAQGLLERSGSLSEIGAKIGQGIGALQAADNGITAISKVITQLKSVAQQALASADPTEQAALQGQYNTLRGQIDSLAEDSSYGGVNLIKANPATLTVSGAGITVDGAAADSASLGISAAGGWAGNPSAIESDLATLDAATTALRSQAASLGSANTQLQISAGFVQSQGAIASQGANRLTGADLNEAAASAQAANTYRQLGLAALRNAGQSQDAVLGLFTRS